MEIRNIFEVHFSVIEDTRCQCDVKHKLIDVLILIVCAVLCNKTEAEEIADYGIYKASIGLYLSGLLIVSIYTARIIYLKNSAALDNSYNLLYTVIQRGWK